MKTSFGVINDNVYEISEWHQLVNVPSEIPNVKLSVNDISDSICRGVSISIYNAESKLNYVTFFIASNDSSVVPVSNFVMSTDFAISTLSLFGFRVQFASVEDDEVIEEATITIDYI